MKVGKYGKEAITHSLPRILAEYQAERAESPNTFYPYGYQGSFAAVTVRDLLRRHIEKMESPPLSIDVVFSPDKDARRVWRKACKENSFPLEFSRPKTKSWRYMRPSVPGMEKIPERYVVWGKGTTPYYALLVKDIELFTDPNAERWIDLRTYRKMKKNNEDGFVLRGQWKRSSAIPCFNAGKLAEHPKKPEPVIAKAKLVYPYAIQLIKEPFQSV